MSWLRERQTKQPASWPPFLAPEEPAPRVSPERPDVSQPRSAPGSTLIPAPGAAQAASENSPLRRRAARLQGPDRPARRAPSVFRARCRALGAAQSPERARCRDRRSARPRLPPSGERPARVRPRARRPASCNESIVPPCRGDGRAERGGGCTGLPRRCYSAYADLLSGGGCRRQAPRGEQP